MKRDADYSHMIKKLHAYDEGRCFLRALSIYDQKIKLVLGLFTSDINCLKKFGNGSFGFIFP